MPDDEKADIARKLIEEVLKAQRRQRRASRRFAEVIRGTPSGLPYSDGAFRIKQAGQEARLAFQLYSRALERYSEFIRHGVMPKDHKKRL